MQSKKRYVVTLDMYVYADNDYMARKRAHKIADKIDTCNITEIGEQPFASMSYRKLEDITKPAEKVKDQPLPF